MSLMNHPVSAEIPQFVFINKFPVVQFVQVGSSEYNDNDSVLHNKIIVILPKLSQVSCSSVVERHTGVQWSRLDPCWA